MPIPKEIKKRGIAEGVRLTKKLSKQLKDHLDEYAAVGDMDKRTLKHNVQQWLNKTPKERTRKEVTKEFGGLDWHERNVIDPIKAFKVDSPKARLTEPASVPDVIRSIKKGGTAMNKGGFVSKQSKPRGVGAAKRGYGRAMR